MQQVFFRQPDLDTVVAAYVLGVRPDTPVTAVLGEAPVHALADPTALCLECGDPGGVSRGNFDHHGSARPLPPACVQALALRPGACASLRRLVAYAAAVDLAGRLPRPRRWPDLSHLCSGVRLAAPGPEEAFRRGLEVVEAVNRDRLSPFGPLPRRPEWAAYLAAKEGARASLSAAREGARRFPTRSGRTAGWLEAAVPGVHGALRALGCQITVALSPPGPGGAGRKVTVASADLRVSGYLPALAALEPGWGGPDHGTVVASPLGGTRLAPQVLLQVVEDDRALAPADPARLWSPGPSPRREPGAPAGSRQVHARIHPLG
jgi:hypothetical protein